MNENILTRILPLFFCFQISCILPFIINLDSMALSCRQMLPNYFELSFFPIFVRTFVLRRPLIDLIGRSEKVILQSYERFSQHQVIKHSWLEQRLNIFGFDWLLTSFFHNGFTIAEQFLTLI